MHCNPAGPSSTGRESFSPHRVTLRSRPDTSASMRGKSFNLAKSLRFAASVTSSSAPPLTNSKTAFGSRRRAIPRGSSTLGIALISLLEGGLRGLRLTGGQQVAAINHKRRTGDPAGSIASQKDRDGRDVVRLSDPAECGPAGEDVLPTFPVDPRHVGPDETRSQGVHPHTGCQFLRQLAREVYDCRFRDGVVRDPRLDPEAADGGEIDHGAAVLLKPSSPCRLSPGDYRVLIDLDGLLHMRRCD